MIHKLLLFDTETTGLLNARCIQLAYRRLDAFTMKEEGAKHVMFNPPFPIEIGAMAVHHITNEAVAECGTFADALTAVQALVNTHCLVAHNAQYDIGVLKNEGIDTSHVTQICTYKLALHLYPDFENHKLQYLRYALGCDRPEFHRMQAHDARADVVVLEQVFYKLLWTFIEEKTPGVDYDEKTIGAALDMMADMSAKPVQYQKFKFGKYKGKTYDEIRLRDKGYLEWLLDSETRKPLCDQDENLTYTLRHYLQ